MTAPVNEAAIPAFWQKVAAVGDTFMPETVRAMSATGQATPEFDRLADALQQVHPELLLVVGDNGPGTKPEIVVSAGGVRAVFPAVFAVVDAAPTEVTHRFTVLALRPRGPVEGFGIRMRDQVVDANTVRWTGHPSRRDKTVADIALYLPGFHDALPAQAPLNENAVQVGFLLLDHLIGEYGTATQVGVIDFASLGKAPADAQPLADLAAYLDHLSARD